MTSIVEEEIGAGKLLLAGRKEAELYVQLSTFLEIYPK